MKPSYLLRAALAAAVAASFGAAMAQQALSMRA